MIQFLSVQNELKLIVIDTFITPRGFNYPKTRFVNEALKTFEANKI